MLKCDDPASLALGTEVSAKFKGAYCEAKIKKVEKSLKIKVSLKEAPFGQLLVVDSDLPNARFQANELTDVVYQKKFIRCQILSIKDQSKYHVVFNDGDEKELRRTQLVLKGGKHFDEDGNLDSMPLTNPESFSTSVIRGAAKRGAQRIRNAISEASSSRGSHTNENDEDDEDNDAEDEEGEEEEEVEEEAKRRGKEKRKAATNAISTMGEQNEVNDTTQSEESVADSTEEREKLKEKRWRKGETTIAGSSRNVPSDSKQNEDDILRSPSTSQSVVNGAAPSAARKSQKQLDKRAEKEERRRQKQERREEILKQKEEEKRRKHEGKARAMELRRREKLFRTAIKRIKRKHEHSMRQILSHRSVRYYFKLVELKRKRRKKKLLLYMEKSRIRNFKLYLKWRDFSLKLQMTYYARFVRQWWRMSTNQLQKIIRSQKLLKNKTRKKCVQNWLRGLEKEKIKFVVIHESIFEARKALAFIDRSIQKQTYTERCEWRYEDIASSTIKSHFQTQIWYPAVIFPQVFTEEENGSKYRQRIVRHMGTGKLLQVWEDDLIPFEWLPYYPFSEFREIVNNRPEQFRKKFKLAWKFATDYAEKRLDLSTIRSFLQWKRMKTSDRLKITTISNTIPHPSLPLEENIENSGMENMLETPEPSDTEYDSDESIKNASPDTRDKFVMKLFGFHDMWHNDINSNPSIQGFEIDLFYFFELAKKEGSVKRVYSADKWKQYGRKLVPDAVDPEEELKNIFKIYLQPFFAMNNKLDGTMDIAKPRSERRQVLPGQYSESKKKRMQAMHFAQSLSSSTDYQKLPLKKSKPGPGRKRKLSSESLRSNKRGRKSISRTTTASPEPAEHNDQIPGTSRDSVQTDDIFDAPDDNASDSSRTRKSRTPGRRSLSIRRETTPSAIASKKGRPRKNTTALSVVAAPKVEIKSIKKEENEPHFVRANVLSKILSGQKLQAYYGTQWFKAIAIDDAADYSDEIMEVMLALQDYYTPESHRLSTAAIQDLERIFDKIRAKTHYTGWNQRYDEYMKLEKLKVTVEDQAKSRSRFRKLSRGRELRPETLALVEQHFHNDEEGIVPRTLNFYVKMARDALKSPEPEMEVDNLEAESVKEDVRPHSELGSDSEEMTKTTPQPSTSTEVNGRKITIINDELEVMEVKTEETEEKTVHDFEVPQKSSDTSLAISPEKSSITVSEQSTEVGEESRGISPSVSPLQVPRPTQIISETLDVSLTIPTASQELTSQDASPDADNETQPIEGCLELESDEPPESPDVETMRPPMLEQYVPILNRMSSGSSSNYPSLSRHGSSNSSVKSLFSPVNSLVLSGPLTLEEVPPTMPSALSALEKNDFENSEEFRKRSKSSESSDADPPKHKRARRASERSTGFGDASMLRSPRRFLTQISSGALSLDITSRPSEASGPIEPLSINRGRRKTASPTLLESGPLTLSPSSSKGRPPTASPLGKHKKTPSTSRKPEEEENDSASATTASETVELSVAENSAREEITSEEGGSTSPEHKEASDSIVLAEAVIVTPKNLSVRGGKRKRGSGRFGGSYSSKTPKQGRKPKETHDDDEEKDDNSSPYVSTSTCPSKADSFQAQKLRMARLMEQSGEPFDFSLLGIPDFETIRKEAPKEDESILIEERSYELREIYTQCKSELSALERKYRNQNEARQKAEAVKATESTSSSTHNQ